MPEVTKRIFELDEEVTPVATDEMEIQKTNDGDSFKATIGNILNKVLGVLGIDLFKLNVNAGKTVAQGEMAYNLDEDTFDFGIGGATWQGYLEWGYNVRNTTGVEIEDGDPVMKAGTIGLSGRILIEPWDGTDPANSVLYMGIATGDIPHNSDGKTTAFGKVRDIDTSAWSEDDILYLSPTTGFVIAPPSPPDILMPTALVINSHQDSGTIHVRALPIDFNAFQPYDAATAKTDVAQEYTATQNAGETALAIVGGNVAWDLSANQSTTLTLTEDAVMSTPTGFKAGATYNLSVAQDATGGWTLDFSNIAFQFPGGTEPIITPAANAEDELSFKDKGSVLHGAFIQDFN